MHACEGEQYRRGIVEAANDLGLPALRPPWQNDHKQAALAALAVLNS